MFINNRGIGLLTRYNEKQCHATSINWENPTEQRRRTKRRDINLRMTLACGDVLGHAWRTALRHNLCSNWVISPSGLSVLLWHNTGISCLMLLSNIYYVHFMIIYSMQYVCIFYLPKSHILLLKIPPGTGYGELCKNISWQLDPRKFTKQPP